MKKILIALIICFSPSNFSNTFKLVNRSHNKHLIIYLIITGNRFPIKIPLEKNKISRLKYGSYNIESIKINGEELKKVYITSHAKWTSLSACINSGSLIEIVDDQIGGFHLIISTDLTINKEWYELMPKGWIAGG